MHDVREEEDQDQRITKSLSVTQSLNRKSRRKLAKEILFPHQKTSYLTKGATIILKRRQARPPGCTFLGAKAITVPVCLMEESGTPTDLVIDSGSDISLIS